MIGTDGDAEVGFIEIEELGADAAAGEREALALQLAKDSVARPEGMSRNDLRNVPTASGSANCSPEKPATKRRNGVSTFTGAVVLLIPGSPA